MNAAVGSASAGNPDGLAKEPRERRFEYARYGTRRRLPLKAAKIRSVVRNGQAKPRQRFALRSSAFTAAKSCWNARLRIMT
jgi:hypothetical protein